MQKIVIGFLLLMTQLIQAHSKSKPNIMLVLADDLGWGDIGYNGGQAATPNLDRYCAEGIRFDRFYVQPICTPTRSALMTGRYPWRYGMASGVVLNHLSFGLPLDEVTLGEVMTQAGYYSAIVGKWHLGHHEDAYLPTERGFYYHYGLYGAIDHFNHHWQGGLDWHRNKEPVREKGYATDLLGNDCVRLIKEHDFDDQPLFLYHAMFAVHAFNQAPDYYTRPYKDVSDPKRKGLLGLCAAMDKNFGDTMDALEAVGQLENTLVIFLSDNGGDLGQAADNGPLKGSKGSYYEGGVRVPAFAYWPGKIEPGSQTSAPVHAVDVFSTLAAVGGVQTGNLELDGFDLSEALQTGDFSQCRTEIPLMLLDSERGQRGAIIDWPWKLYRSGSPFKYELYHLENDPYERENQSAMESDRVHRMSARLDQLNQGAPVAFWRSGDGIPPKGWRAPAIIGPQ